MDEIERIRKAYEKRKNEQKNKLYTCFDKGNLFIIHQREKVLLNALENFKFSNLSEKKILDVGCGTGGILRDFIKYGAKPENLYAVDLLEGRIKIAKQLSPNIHFICRNASILPFESGYFDIVMQFTVFTSILDSTMKQRVAIEMLRVLHPSGIIIWYDYHMDNPKNPDVKGVKKKQINSLFPNCYIRLKRLTLAPPITRPIAPYSWLACYILEKIPILRTHYLGIIKKVL